MIAWCIFTIHECHLDTYLIRVNMMANIGFKYFYIWYESISKDKSFAVIACNFNFIDIHFNISVQLAFEYWARFKLINYSRTSCFNGKTERAASYMMDYFSHFWNSEEYNTLGLKAIKLLNFHRLNCLHLKTHICHAKYVCFMPEILSQVQFTN